LQKSAGCSFFSTNRTGWVDRLVHDIDILVRFKSTLSLLQLVHVENLMSQKLGIQVDLVTEGAVKNRILKESIQQDLQIIFQ
jgi:predicted nucleotidyltransferase